MREVSSDPDTMKGSVFHRLFQRAFPGYFKNNSVHMWQPFYTPAKNLVFAKEQNYLPQLDISDLIIDSKNKGKAYRKLAKHDSITTEGEVLPAEVARPAQIVSTSNYSDIKERILGSEKAQFQNPGITDKVVLPSGSLGDIIGEGKAFCDALDVLQTLITKETPQMFMEYFVEMSKAITAREQRKFQKVKTASGLEQVYQIDVVKE